jgi:hypothetical protein
MRQNGCEPAQPKRGTGAFATVGIVRGCRDTGGLASGG